jgi:hypothetical protein
MSLFYQQPLMKLLRQMTLVMAQTQSMTERRPVPSEGNRAKQQQQEVCGVFLA